MYISLKKKNMCPVHPPIVNDEVWERKLMWIKDEWCDAKSSDGYPEVNQEWCPDGHRHIEKHDQRSHAKIDTWSGESGEENTKRYTTGCESTSCCNITSTSECQVAEDGVSIDLG